MRADRRSGSLNPSTTPLLLEPADGAGGGGCYIYLLTALSAIGGFLFGYDTGVVSGAMLLLDKEFDFTPRQQESIVSITLVGCILAAMCSSVATERLGRQPVIRIGSLIFTAGAVVLAVSQNFATLLVGRFIIGVAVGLASMAVPLYIAEAAPPDKRGTLVTVNNVFVTGGQFIACVVDALFSKVDYPHGWRFMLGLAAVPAVIQFIGFLFLPESPRWLAKHKGAPAARRVLQKIRGTQAVDAELEMIIASIRADQGVASSGLMTALREAPLRRAMALGCMLQLIQQLTGINTVMYYCGTIFVMAGYIDPTLAIWLSAAVSLIGWLFCFLGVVAVERMGRRRLTLTSLAGVIVALVALGGGFKYSEMTSETVVGGSGDCARYSSCFDCVADDTCGFCPSASDAGYCVPGNATAPTLGAAAAMCNSTTSAGGRNSTRRWFSQSTGCPASGRDGSNLGGKISLVATAAYLAAFQPGMGTMPWTINSEIYPLHARSLGVSLATMTNWCSNLLISYTFLDLTRAVTTPGAFWIYAAVGVLGWAWFYCNLPETRGLPLEKIGELFARPGDAVATRGSAGYRFIGSPGRDAST